MGPENRSHRPSPRAPTGLLERGPDARDSLPIDLPMPPADGPKDEEPTARVQRAQRVFVAGGLTFVGCAAYILATAIVWYPSRGPAGLFFLAVGVAFLVLSRTTVWLPTSIRGKLS